LNLSKVDGVNRMNTNEVGWKHCWTVSFGPNNISPKLVAGPSPVAAWDGNE
jgi:hypothetical protein